MPLLYEQNEQHFRWSISSFQKNKSPSKINGMKYFAAIGTGKNISASLAS